MGNLVSLGFDGFQMTLESRGFCDSHLIIIITNDQNTPHNPFGFRKMSTLLQRQNVSITSSDDFLMIIVVKSDAKCVNVL
jgi:hypothetical protein